LHVYDFHTHTTLSDGVLTPVELIRRAAVAGYKAIGIADHVGAGALHRIIDELRRDCELVRQYWDIIALPGVELTHVPPASIATLAAEARAAGAVFVVVHGESPVEPVEPGTNLAAAECRDVDLLAHPGLVNLQAVEAAAANGVFLEVTARQGHSLGNGRVVRLAREAGAMLLLSSDCHQPNDLLSAEFARTVALGAGLEENEASRLLWQNGEEFLRRCMERL
jgi:putative hydrolase